MSEKYRIADYESADYSSLWDAAQRRYDNLVERKVLADLLPSGNWFVDLGCAHGRLSDIYVERFKHCVLVDYSMRHLKLAQEKWGERENVIFMSADIYRLPFRQGTFDVALMVRVLHHLEKPAVAISEIGRVLKPAGRLVTNYRNRRDLRNIIRHFLGLKNNGPFKVAHDDPSGRDKLQAFTHPKLARQLLENAGFRVNRSRGTSFFGGKFLRVMQNPVPIEYPLTPLLGALKLSPLIFLDARRSGVSEKPSSSPSSIEDVLVCPCCRSDLELKEKEYHCRTCAKNYPYTDGILDFRDVAASSRGPAAAERQG